MDFNIDEIVVKSPTEIKSGPSLWYNLPTNLVKLVVILSEERKKLKSEVDRINEIFEKNKNIIKILELYNKINEILEEE